MRDWQNFVREKLKLPDLTAERQARIVRELAAQLEDFYRDALAAGRSEAEADAHACRQVRDWERLAQDVWLADRPHARPRLERLAGRLEERTQGEPGGSMLADVLRDVRFALRQLWKAPAFAAVAVLTVGLGTGATSTMFSVINGVLLRPLPYPEYESLMRVVELVPRYGRFSVAPATFLDWRAQSASFERIAAYNGGSATFVGGDGPERISNAAVSWDLFELLRMRPLLGRGFRADEDAPGKNAVIVLSHGMWQRRFGGDAGVVGRSVTLSGAAATVIGVMPAGFAFPRDAEYWTPLALNPSNAPRGAHFLSVIARLKPGVSKQRAAAEMKTIAERLAQQYPEASAKESAEVVPLLELMIGDARGALWTLLAAVGVVVLIACANVANLLLVRASAREKEIAIRTSLGASRGRLARQMLTESLILAVAGAAFGLLMARLAIAPIRALSAGAIPRVQDISVDGTVLLFALAVAVAVGMLFGMVPAWQAARGDVAAVIKEGGRSSAAGGAGWTRSTLLVAEVSLSIVLLVAASLLMRSFSRLTDVDPGFRGENVLAFRVALPQAAYRTPDSRAAFFDELLARLQQTPGLRAAGMVQTLPMRGDYTLAVAIQGRPAPAPGDEPSANFRVVSPRYFAALGIPLERGRVFDERDHEKSKLVAVVDEAFAARHFPSEDPLGRGLDIGNGTDGFYEIVGVVGNVRQSSLDAKPSPTMYIPYRQDVFSAMWLVARTDADPMQLSGVARQTVRQLDPALPSFAMTRMSDVVSESIAERRFSMLLLGAFAAIALLLAAVGIYGVVAYSVTQRTAEIGVRLAVGAAGHDILALVVGGGMRLALCGVAFGLAAAGALSRVMERMLFEVTPLDPISYLATAATLLAVAGLACYVPARRAMAVDPLTAIRHE